MTQLIRGWPKHLTPPVPGWQRTDPLDRGLVGEWRFDENTGLLLPDYSGSAFHSVSFGGDPTWVVTRYGPGLQCDTVDDDVSFGNVDVADSATSLTVEVFVRLDEAPTAPYGYLFSQEGAWPANDDTTFILRKEAILNRIEFTVVNAATLHEAAYVGGLTQGAFHHIVGTYDGAFVRVYVNAVLGGVTVAMAGAVETSTRDLMLNESHQYGGRNGAWTYLLARVYKNHALSINEIRERYEICLKRAQPLTHVWMMPWGMAPVAPPVGGHMTLWGRYWGP